jgi:peptidoglycan hydrolase CwlO-like protein
MQKQLDEFTARIKKNESELRAKDIEIANLKDQIKVLKEVFKNS